MAVDQDTINRWAGYRNDGGAYDGDTIQGQRVLGIDAPEKAGDYAGVPADMPGANAARDAMQQALDNGAQITDSGNRGRYGRPLVSVTDDQGNVAQDMAARGLAVPTGDNLNSVHFGVLDELTGNRRRPEWDHLVDQAEREQLDYLRTRFDSLLEQVSHTRTKGANLRPGFGAAAGAALARGTDQMQSSLYGFAETMGEVFGVDALDRWGEDGMLRNMTEAAMNPARIADYEAAAAGGLEGVGMYVLETLLENAPALAVDISAALATGGSGLVAGIGKAALRKLGGAAAVGKAGQVANKAFSGKGLLLDKGPSAGMFASVEAQMVGETRQGQFEEGIEEEDGALLMATGVGTAKSALEFASLQTILRGVMRSGSADAAKEFADTLRETGNLVRLRDVMARAGKVGVTSSMAEGTTEMVQQFMDELATMELDPDREIDLGDLDFKQLLDAGIRGGIFGGTLGTAGATVSGVAGLRENLRQEILEGQQPTTDDTAPEPVDNLKAQAEVRGAVWLSSQQTAEEKEALRAELAQQGEVFERTNDDGATYLTTRSDDPLLNPEVELTGDELTRQKGFVPKSELAEGEERHTAVVRDAQGREVEAIVTDDTNLDSTLAKLDELYPELTVAVEPAEQVLAKRQEALEIQRLGDLPPSEARDAQMARSAEADAEQQGTASVYTDGGMVRPVGELIADYRSRRLNMDELQAALVHHGIDLNQFKKVRAPMDTARTLEAIRRTLAGNKKLAAKYAGIEDAETVKNSSSHQLADWAVQALEGQGPRRIRQALKSLKLKPIKAEVLTQEEVDPETGKVLSVDARKYLLPRIKTRLKGNLPRPMVDRITRQFVGEGGSVETLLGQLDQMDDGQLILLADSVGAKLDGLTKEGDKTQDDVLGMFRELSERSRQNRALTEAHLRELIPIGLDDAPDRAPVRTAPDGTEYRRGLDAQIQAEKQARRPATEEDSAEADSDLLDQPEHDNLPHRRVFVAQAARDIGIIERVAGLTGLALDRSKLLQAYWRWHWPTSGQDDVTPVMEHRADVDQALAEADPEGVQQRLRNLIRYMVAQDILADERIAPENKAAAMSEAFDPESSAEQELANGLKMLAGNFPEDPEGAVVQALTEHGLLGDQATRFEYGDTEENIAGVMDPNSNSGTAIAESFPPAQERDPQEQSDLVFYRAVYQSTLKLKEFTYLEERSATVSPHNWSEDEKAYQRIRSEFVADPATFSQRFRTEHLPKLIELRAVRFTSTLSQFTAESEARARIHTHKAGGRNLLMVEYAGDSGPVFRLVDAVTLANYAKDKHPANAAEALVNLESNLARLAQGPESSNVKRLLTNGLVQVSDDTVIWFDGEGQPVTAATARKAQRGRRSDAEQAVEASRRKEQAVEELAEVEQIIEETLGLLEDQAGLTDKDRQGIAIIRSELNPETPFDPSANRFWASNRTSQVERAEKVVLEAQKRLDDMVERHRTGRTKMSQERQASARRTAERGLEAARQQLRTAVEGAASHVEAEQRLKEARLSVARLADADLGHGVIAQLKHVLDRRINLLSEIKRLNEAVARDAAAVDTNLRGWEVELSADLDYRSENDIDEEGFDQDMARRDWDSLDIEADLYEEGDGFTPDPMDQAVFRDSREAELTEVEAAVDMEVQELTEGERRFVYVASPQRGMQMPLDGTLPGATARTRRAPQSSPRRVGKRKFSGTKVRGKAKDRQSFNALAAFTRRLMLNVSKGMKGAQKTAFLNTPITIVQTGDLAELHKIAQDAGHLATPKELAVLAARPGYLNLGSTVVISMDPLRPNGNPAEWSLVFGHELGHMIYDQSWHLLSQADREALQDMYFNETGGVYNGKEGFTGFKEWFADQMSAAIAKDVTTDRRSQYLDAKGVLGKALRFVIDNLKRMFDAIQADKTVRKLARFKLNLEFDEFARRILRGEMPLSHRYAVGELETMHFTPDETPLPRAGIEARMKQAHKGKLKPTGLIRSVIGRIRDYSTELANLLHQSANQSRAGDGAYEQKRYAMGNLWMAELQKAYDQIGRGRNQQEKVNQAYAELREGKDTAGAKALREVLDRIIADAKKRGWASGYSLKADFVPQAFNHQAVEAKRGRLFELAKEALPKATDEEINDQIDRIVDGFGLQELSHEPMGPGRPVGTHAGAKTLLDAIGSEKLTKEGLLQDKGYGMLQHFVAGVAKRAAWESTFGGYVDKQGAYSPAMQASARRLARAGETVFFDPNARYKQLLETIAAEHGDHAAAEVKDLVLGAMGHRNLGVKKWARVSQEWATGITNLMILGFSGVASIPELATAFVRADFGFADIAASLRNYGEAKRFAYDIGVAMTTGAEQAMRESMGEGYQSSAINKANSVFFTLNGQQFITRLSRTVGTAVAMRYVLKAAAEGDYASLKKLGLTPEQVRQWDRAGRPAYTADMQGALAETALAVSNGVSQFVNEGTLNPNKFQSANWGNNPYMKVIWHLKQFLWTFGDTVVGGIARSVREQYQQGKAAGYSAPLSALMATATPMWAMGLMMPLAAMSLALRGLLAGQDRFEDEELDDLAIELMRKTGAFAQWDLLHGLLTANKWDQGWVSYPGAVIPMVSVADQIIAVRDGQLDLEQSAKNLTGMAPLAGQWKGTWQWLLE